MRLTHILVLALAFTLIMDTASAKYTEYLKVQVFDQNYRAVEGAQVYAQHQLNAVAGLTKTKPKLTDARGDVNISFTDYEEIVDSTVYAYTLYVKYGNYTGTAELIAGNHTKAEPRLYSFTINAYYLAIKATDQAKNPIVGAITVTARSLPNFTKTAVTNQFGKAEVHLPPGNFDVRLETPVFTKVENVDINTVTGDRNLDFLIGLYAMDIVVLDNNRSPLNATIEVNGAMKSTDQEGRAHFVNITEPNPTVNVKYGRLLKKIKPQLDRQNMVEVVFDVDKPEIKELYASVSKTGVGTITLFADDKGKSASGIESVSVVYEVNGVQGTLQTYTVGYNSFETKVPAQMPGSLVKYTVTVTDRDGNSESSAGTYSIPEEETSPDDKYVPKETGISLEVMIVGIVVFAAAVYGVVYYFNKKKEAEETEAEAPYKDQLGKPPASPPVAPPAIPRK